MNSFFSVQQQRNATKIASAYTIAIGLVITLLVAVPPTLADDEKEINNTVLYNSVAVLPFENLSPNSDNAYFAAGVYKNILNQLRDIGDMSVILPTTVARFIGSDKTVSEIASELNVATIVKGSVSYANNRVKINVQHIDASNGNQLWSKVYEHDLPDIIAIQAEIVEHIAMAVGADLSLAELERIRKIPTQSLEAYTLYLKAMQLYSSSGVNKPAYYQYLDQAIAVDPKFALIHALKADDYAYAKVRHAPVGDEGGGPAKGGGNLTFDEMEKIALEHAGIALELDPNMAIAYKAQASIHRTNMNSPKARKRYERAFELSPAVYYSVSTLYYYSVIGEYDNAIKVAQRLLDLGPNDAFVHDNLGWVLLCGGKYAAAAEQFRKSIALKSNFYRYHTNLGLAEIMLGNDEEGLRQLRIADELIKSSKNLKHYELVAYGYARLGLKEDAARIVNLFETMEAKGEMMRPYGKAMAYLAIGNADGAYDILAQKPYEGGLHFLQVMKSNMMKDPVLEEPRFVEIRNQSGW